MPIYTYQYLDGDGECFDEYQKMADDPLTEHDGRPVRKVVRAPRLHTSFGNGNHADPIKMLSMAKNSPQEIEEFRRRNPGVEISSRRSDPDYGVPVAKSRSEKLRILKNEGWVELS